MKTSIFFRVDGTLSHKNISKITFEVRFLGNITKDARMVDNGPNPLFMALCMSDSDVEPLMQTIGKSPNIVSVKRGRIL